MKKKIFKTLAIFGACLGVPLLLTGCQAGDNDLLDFRVQDGYIQYTKDGKTWENIILSSELKGESGKGIKKIMINNSLSDETKTTYIIVFDDNTTYSYVVKNGTNGTDGEDGSVVTIGEDGYWYIDRVKTDVKAKGTDGTNGTNGTDGEDGEDGSVVTIGEDGYWYIDGVKTDVKAKGENGADGSNGADGKDAEIDTYTITYDYGAADTFFAEVKETETIKATQWLTTVPEIYSEYKDAFLGWFISGTEKQIKNYDFIGGNVTLEARFDREKLGLSGLYNNGMYLKTWADIVEENPDPFVTEGVIDGYLRNLGGELVIDNSINTIGRFTFTGSASLKYVYIPANVTDIIGNPFSYCDALEGIVVDKNNIVYDSRNNCNAIVESSTNALISGCNNTIIPNSVLQIRSAAFDGSGIKSVSIPSSVTFIGDYGIPSSVNTFEGCNSLESIIVEDGNENYDSRNNCNAIIRKSDNMLISGCKNTIIPEDVITIGYRAFARLSIENFVIPEHITTIKEWAFGDCGLLKQIHISEGVTTIEKHTFANCYALKTIIIDNETISNNLINYDSNGNVIYYATTVYIKSGLAVESSTYLLENYTKQETSDKTGYDMYVKNAE